MKKFFSYSILQYKHSLLLNEALNVGVLYWFPDDSFAHFEVGNLARLRGTYQNFDTISASKAVQAIKNKLHREYTGLFNPIHYFDNENVFKSNLLRKDDSALQFTDFKKAPYPFNDIKKIIKQYSNLLLPKHEGAQNRIRHDEKYIIKQYTDYINETSRLVTLPVKRNVQIESKGVKLKFEIGWQNGTNNLVKPISFDLSENLDIQNKSIQYFGYLTKLNEYAEKNNISYHLIVGSPQLPELHEEYEKALDIIRSADSPKRIITENELKSYSQETAKYLLDKVEKET